MKAAAARKRGHSPKKDDGAAAAAPADDKQKKGGNKRTKKGEQQLDDVELLRLLNAMEKDPSPGGISWQQLESRARLCQQLFEKTTATTTTNADATTHSTTLQDRVNAACQQAALAIANLKAREDAHVPNPVEKIFQKNGTASSNVAASSLSSAASTLVTPTKPSAGKSAPPPSAKLAPAAGRNHAGHTAAAKTIAPIAATKKSSTSDNSSSTVTTTAAASTTGTTSTTTTTNVADLQKQQREQMEAAVAQMAGQMKEQMSQLHGTIQTQTNDLLDGMENVTAQNVVDVTYVAQAAHAQVKRNWRRSVATWTMVWTIVGAFGATFVTIQTIPKTARGPRGLFSLLCHDKDVHHGQQPPARANNRVCAMLADVLGVRDTVTNTATSRPEAVVTTAQKEPEPVATDAEPLMETELVQNSDDETIVDGAAAAAAAAPMVDDNADEEEDDADDGDDGDDGAMDDETEKYQPADEYDESEEYDSAEKYDPADEEYDDAGHFENEEDEEVRTPLYEAALVVAQNDVELLRSYLDRQPNLVNEQDNNGWALLHEAAWNGRVEMAALLLEYDANESLITAEGFTALDLAYQAIDEDDHPIFRLLTNNNDDDKSEAGDDEDSEDGDEEGEIAIEVDAYGEQQQHDIKVPDGMEAEMLREATLREFAEMQAAAAQKPVPDEESEQRQREEELEQERLKREKLQQELLLHQEQQQQHQEVAEQQETAATSQQQAAAASKGFLIYEGKPFGGRDLRRAATRGDARRLASFLDSVVEGDDSFDFLDEQDQNNWTALHLAIRGGHTEVVRLLLRAGAETLSRNNLGQTAREMAADRLGDEHEIVALLDEHNNE